jgi:hypothetical protein
MDILQGETRIQTLLLQGGNLDLALKNTRLYKRLGNELFLRKNVKHLRKEWIIVLTIFCCNRKKTNTYF